MVLCVGVAIACSCFFLVAIILLLCIWFCCPSSNQRDSSLATQARRTICLEELLFMHESSAACTSPRMQINLYSALFGRMHDDHPPEPPLNAAMQGLIDRQNATITQLAGMIWEWEHWYLISRRYVRDPYSLHADGLQARQSLGLPALGPGRWGCRAQGPRVMGPWAHELMCP